MSSLAEKETLVTPEAFKAYNRIGGAIRELALRLVVENLKKEDRSTADVADVKRAYAEACRQVLEKK